MANKYWSDEKASKEDAEEELKKHIRGVYDKIFAVRFTSDDGGNVIELVLERENPKEQIEQGLLDMRNGWDGEQYWSKRHPATSTVSFLIRGKMIINLSDVLRKPVLQ